jgi:hypothetical protein
MVSLDRQSTRDVDVCGGGRDGCNHGAVLFADVLAAPPPSRRRVG